MSSSHALAPALVVLTTFAALTSCATAPSTPQPPPGGTTPRPAASGGSSVPQPTLSPPATLAIPPTVPPAPPAPDALTTNFHDPVAVARAWMTQWCATDHREHRNGNVERATVYSTTAGKTADLAAGDSPAAFLKVIEQKISHRCDQLTAEISPQAPHGPDVVHVRLTARRTMLAAGQPVRAELVSTTRVVRGWPDGSWLVDRQVEAG